MLYLCEVVEGGEGGGVGDEPDFETPEPSRMKMNWPSLEGALGPPATARKIRSCAVCVRTP